MRTDGITPPIPGILSRHQRGLRRVLKLASSDLGEGTLCSSSQLRWVISCYCLQWPMVHHGNEQMLPIGIVLFSESWLISQHITVWVKQHDKCSHNWRNIVELVKNQTVIDLKGNSSLTRLPKTNIYYF